MIEGLAVWALFIYLLRLVGMPWNMFIQGFAYLGGGGWLAFVWFGLITYTPMDLSGGSLVQSPHVHLRPASAKINGFVKRIYVKPNQTVSKGQLIYELDNEPYQLELAKAETYLNSAKVDLKITQKEVANVESSYQSAMKDVDINKNKLAAVNEELKFKRLTLERYIKQNQVVKYTITESVLDEQKTAVKVDLVKIKAINLQIEKSVIVVVQEKIKLEKAKLTVNSRELAIKSEEENIAQVKWNIEKSKVYAPTDGYLTNFIMREGQYIGIAPRMQMYTNEKYVLMRVNHQAIRNVKPGQMAEFSSAVYPGKIFFAEVEGIIEATGEAQGSLLARDDNVRQVTGANVANKHHFVRLKLIETDGYDLPVGSVGIAWISAEKPISFLGFLDVIRGIIIRMKSQIFYVWSM